MVQKSEGFSDDGIPSKRESNPPRKRKGDLGWEAKPAKSEVKRTWIIEPQKYV